jgi:ABC-type lipoprotein export system ATPase subunit
VSAKPAAAAQPVLAVAGVTKTFRGGRVTALHGITLDVAPGEYVAVMGPSGCGKSTLLHVLCGIEVPDSGSVTFNGRTNPTHREWVGYRARHIGLVFQAGHLLPTLTAVQNIEVPMFGQIRSRPEREQRARLLLERVGLTDRSAHRPSALSGGEQQRVALARSLANAPLAVLADEPTGNLDSASARDVLDLLDACRRETAATIVVATHDSAVAARAARTVVLADGAVVDDRRA